MTTDILAELSVFAERFPKMFMSSLRCTWYHITGPPKSRDTENIYGGREGSVRRQWPRQKQKAAAANRQVASAYVIGPAQCTLL